MVHFSAKIQPAGHKCEIAIDGDPLPSVRGFSIHTNVSEISKLHVEMLLLEPFEVNGEAEVIVNTRVVNKEIARKTYENLKKYFKEDEANEDRFGKSVL
jgi:hypothetical protein